MNHEEIIVGISKGITKENHWRIAHRVTKGAEKVISKEITE